MVRTITLAEVKQHDSTSSDPWIVILGKVVAINEYKDEHPGGDEVLLEYSGRDATKYFKEIGHGSNAEQEMVKYIVGELETDNKVEQNH